MIIHPSTPMEEREVVFVTKFGHFSVGMGSQIKLLESRPESEFFGLIYEYSCRAHEVERVLKAVWQHANRKGEEFNTPHWDILIVFNSRKDLDLFLENVESKREWEFNLQLVLKEDFIWSKRLP